MPRAPDEVGRILPRRREYQHRRDPGHGPGSALADGPAERVPCPAPDSHPGFLFQRRLHWDQGRRVLEPARLDERHQSGRRIPGRPGPGRAHGFPRDRALFRDRGNGSRRGTGAIRVQPGFDRGVEYREGGRRPRWPRLGHGSLRLRVRTGPGQWRAAESADHVPRRRTHLPRQVAAGKAGGSRLTAERLAARGTDQGRRQRGRLARRPRPGPGPSGPARAGGDGSDRYTPSQPGGTSTSGSPGGPPGADRRDRNAGGRGRSARRGRPGRGRRWSREGRIDITTVESGSPVAAPSRGDSDRGGGRDDRVRQHRDRLVWTRERIVVPGRHAAGIPAGDRAERCRGNGPHHLPGAGRSRTGTRTERQPVRAPSRAAARWPGADGRGPAGSG